MTIDREAAEAENEQNQSARMSAQAKGGIMPRDEDPTDPKRAAERSAGLRRAMEEGGFGDDKGGRD